MDMHVILTVASWCAVCVVAIILLSGTFFTIEQAEVAAVERFGRFIRLAHPGLNTKIPLIERVSYNLSMRVQQLDVKVDTKTHDNVFVHVVVSVQYHVVSGSELQAFYRLTDHKKQITSHVFNSVRSQVPKMDLDHVFEKKEEIEKAVISELQAQLNAYGYDIDSSPVTDIQPDDKVRNAMNEINAARRLREAAEYQGDAVRIKMVKEAEAQKESKKLQGEGVAAERIAITEGIKASVAMLLDAGETSSAEAMRTLIMAQYFDTIRSIGSGENTKTIFLPHSPGGLLDISKQIAEAIMVGREA